MDLFYQLKLAALHVQYFQKNNEVLNNVSEVEMLSHELSRKIWQKIMMLDLTMRESGLKNAREGDE
ncbi:MAG: hypothetical protein R2824_21840 [Saprospiraceae bacterium]